jgi:6-phosphogluconate dehydrogenase (decarboxylating)
MCHWSEYEPYDIVRSFELWCDDCDEKFELSLTAQVWRDGTVYAQWVCPVCDENNSSEDLGNVADFVDYDMREGK